MKILAIIIGLPVVWLLITFVLQMGTFALALWVGMLGVNSANGEGLVVLLGLPLLILYWFCVAVKEIYMASTKDDSVSRS